MLLSRKVLGSTTPPPPKTAKCYGSRYGTVCNVQPVLREVMDKVPNRQAGMLQLLPGNQQFWFFYLLYLSVSLIYHKNMCYNMAKVQLI